MLSGFVFSVFWFRSLQCVKRLFFHLVLVLQNAKMDISSPGGIASLLLGLFCSIYKAVRPHSCAFITAYVCRTCMSLHENTTQAALKKHDFLMRSTKHSFHAPISRTSISIYTALSPPFSLFFLPPNHQLMQLVPLTLTEGDLRRSSELSHVVQMGHFPKDDFTS